MSVTWDPDELMARVRRGALQGVTIGAHIVLDHATELLNSPPKTGRVYRRRGVAHQASAPGEAPATDTARLARSGDVYVDEATVTARANWSTAYALPLEVGTARMAARPYARRSLTEKLEEVEQAVTSQIAAAMT